MQGVLEDRMVVEKDSKLVFVIGEGDVNQVRGYWKQLQKHLRAEQGWVRWVGLGEVRQGTMGTGAPVRDQHAPAPCQIVRWGWFEHRHMSQDRVAIHSRIAA